MPTQKGKQVAEHNELDKRLSERAALMNEILNAGQNQFPETAGMDYIAYNEALQKLNKLMDKHSAVENDDGLPGILEAAGKEELMAAIEETAKTGEIFLKSLQTAGSAPDPSQDVPGMVIRLQNLLFDDYEMLSAYNPEEAGLSFPELQEDARTQIVDFRGMDLEKLGGSQSTRLAMTVVDEKGRRRQGVFTKATYMDSKGRFEKLLDFIASEYDKPSFQTEAKDYEEALRKNGYEPSGKKGADALSTAEIVQGMKDQLKDMIPKFKNYLIAHHMPIQDMKPQEATEEVLIGHLAYMVEAGKVMGDQNATKDMLKDMGFTPATMGGRAYSLLRGGLERFSGNVANILNTRSLMLKEGDRLDQRNTAMSAVASLLGVPELVARAENMMYLDENGDVQKGTFMEFSKGMDLFARGGGRNLTYICETPFGPPAGIIKSLADLQILDYICGNVDRHGANMTYFTDSNGVFQGVQAIDNDSSFGLCVPGKDGKYNKLGGTDSLRVISSSMATRVRSLSPDMLRFALRGRGLNDAEIGAACHRLKDLQEALSLRCKKVSASKDVLTAGKTLCEMEDRELLSLNINVVKNTKPSIFRSVLEKVGELSRDMRVLYPFNPDERRKETSSLKEVGTTDRRYVAGGIADSMQSMSRAVANSVTGFKVGNLSSFLRSSDQFRSMVKAVKSAKATADRIRKEIVGDRERLDRADPRVKEQLDKANLAMQKVRQSAEIYLQKKMREKGVNSIDSLRGKNPYEQKRIDYAMKLLKDVEEYEELDSPKNEAVREERERVTERVRRSAPRKAKPTNPKSGNPGL